jgi:hypothetical protein
MTMKEDPILDPMLDRREFTLAALLAMLSGVTITVSGCGSSSPSSPTPTPTSSSDKSGQISANHGHTVVITSAQLTAGGAVVLSLQGGGHSHSVELSAGEVVQIRDGARVAKESSSSSGHSHTVTFN